MPYDREFATISRSPIVELDENEALRGSIRTRTPAHASMTPITFARRRRSAPKKELKASVNIGIVAARREVFEAVVSERPEMNKV